MARGPVDRLSSQWVSSHPTHRVELNAAEFGETFTTYMGCESRIVRPYTGRSIPCGARRNTVCDAYGHQVGLAAVPGAPFTDCHDAIAHELWRILLEAGVHVDVEPRGIFTTARSSRRRCCCSRGRRPARCQTRPSMSRWQRRPRRATRRRARGCRCSGGSSTSRPSSAVISSTSARVRATRDEQSGAVAERAHRCAGEYLSAARAADRQYSAPGTNPILDRLRSFGQTRGLAFGAYGDSARGLARRARAAHGGGRRGANAGGGALLHRLDSSLRRRLGLVICREFARHRIRRVPRTSACRGPLSSGACSVASSSGDRRRECRSTCRTPTSSTSTVPGRRGTAGRPRVDAARAARRARSAGPVDGATAY